MPNMKNVHKVTITAVVNRDTRKRLQKVAEATGRTLSIAGGVYTRNPGGRE